jgi:hypothetical protein
MRVRMCGGCVMTSHNGGNYVDERGAHHIRYHGGDAETELFELELGHRAAFDLFHLDSVVFNKELF